MADALKIGVAGLGQVELADEVDDGAFPASGVADQGDDLTGLDGEGDVVQDRSVLDGYSCQCPEPDAGPGN